MKRAPRFILAVLSGMALILASCRSAVPTAPATEAIFTQAAQTIVAGITHTALASSPTAPAPTGTDTPVAETLSAPTETPQPGPTMQPSEQPSDTPLPPTEPASATPGITFELVFEDDFSRQTLWAEEENDRFGFGYAGDGQYRIYVNIINAAIWTIRDQEFADLRLEVDGAYSSGPETGYYGVMCRHQDEDNYYALVISSSGGYGIAKMEGGEFEFLQEGTAPSGVINSGEASNRVRGDCIGETLTLYANDQQVAQVQDGAFDEGVIGLIAGTRQQEGFEALFDNFAVLEPE